MPRSLQIWNVTMPGSLPHAMIESDDALSVDPFELFAAWFSEAKSSEVNDPNAMAVSTVDADGMPNVRMVLLKDVDPAGHDKRGFVFFTNFDGTKGRELQAHPKAALLFHWKSLERQIRVRGVVSAVSDADADAYYATRPRLSRIGAWASAQSRPLESRRVLEDDVERYSKQFGDSEIPRPPHWSGFRVTPLEIEFWMSRPFRLHDRMVFKRQNDSDTWCGTRLYP